MIWPKGVELDGNRFLGIRKDHAFGAWTGEYGNSKDPGHGKMPDGANQAPLS
jgi:hypothetical protein